MTGYHLNHINVRTHDLEATRDFYADVLGLSVGFRPSFPAPGYWMYAGDMAVVHISPAEPGAPRRTDPIGMGQGLDHFALWGSGLTEQLNTLERNGVEYRIVISRHELDQMCVSAGRERYVAFFPFNLQVRQRIIACGNL